MGLEIIAGVAVGVVLAVLVLMKILKRGGGRRGER